MIIKLLKPLSFIPAILVMYMIYSFSAQDGSSSAQLSYQVSYKIVEVGGEVLGADLQPWEVDQLATRFHVPVRKLAHMTEYFVLALTVAFPLYVYGLRGILLLLMAGLICVGFACGDEYHQASVAGRGPSKRDVLIDSIGVFFGIILVRIIGWTSRKTIFRPFSRKKQKTDDYAEEGYVRQPYPPMQPNADYAGRPYGEQPCSQPGYHNMPPYHAYQPDNPNFYDDEMISSSDRLSEDMSLRKLMSDLKDQKQARQATSHKSDGVSRRMGDRRVQTRENRAQTNFR